MTTRYQCAEPFRVDSSEIADRLDVQATPPGQARIATLAEYRDA